MKKTILYLFPLMILLLTLESCPHSYETDFTRYYHHFNLYNYTNEEISVTVSCQQRFVGSEKSNLLQPLEAGKDTDAAPIILSCVPGIYHHSEGMFGTTEQLHFTFTFHNSQDQKIDISSTSINNDNLYTGIDFTSTHDISLIETFLPFSIPFEEYQTLVEKITDAEKRNYFEELYYHTPYQDQILEECHMMNQIPDGTYRVQDRSKYIRNAETIADEFGLFPQKNKYYFAFINS